MRRDGQLPFPPFDGLAEDDDEAGRVVDVEHEVAGGQEAIVVQAAEREARVGVVSHDLELRAFDLERGASVGNGFAQLLVYRPLLGDGGMDAGRPRGALRAVVVVALQVLGNLHQAGRGAEVEGEGMAVGVEVVARIHEGTVHAEVRPPQPEVDVEALLERTVDFVAYHLVGVQQSAGTQFGAFRDDAVDNLFDIDCIAVAHSRLIIRFACR